MKQEKNDKLFKQIASEYIKNTGIVLDEEATQLNHNMSAMPSRPTKPSRRRWIPWVSAIGTAAVILFMVVNIMVLQFAFNRTNKNDSSMPDNNPPVQTADPKWQGPEMTLVNNNRFSVEERLIDNGQYIYKVNDTTNDDVVVTFISHDDFDPSTMRYTYKNEKKIYYKNEVGYKIIALSLEEDWIITLSCAHDIETLNIIFDLIKINSEYLDDL